MKTIIHAALFNDNKVILRSLSGKPMPRFFLLILIFFYDICMAQAFNETNFTRYTKQDGLSNNYVTGIVQDSSGYIWIATNKGLNRFDGKYFSNYFKHSENSPIPENLIWSLNLQDRNEIIGTTVAGAFCYNTVTHKRKYFITPADSNIFFWTNQGWQAIKDLNGNYVVSTKTGLYVFNTAGKIICRYDHYNTRDAGRIELWFGNWLGPLSNGTIFQDNNLSGSLYHPKTNQIDTFYAARTKKIKWRSTWIKNDQRVSFYGKNDELFLPNSTTHSFDVYNLITGSYSSYKIPSSFISDVDWFSKLFYINDTLLAITSKVGGFYLINYSRQQKKLSCDGNKYFASKYCTSIFRDREERLWIGTNDGLFKQNTRNPFFSVYDLSLQLSSLLNTGIQSILTLKRKTFIGLRNDGGLLILNSTTKKIEKQISFEKFGPGSNSINFIFLYKKDTLWIGTARGILWLNINNYSNGRLNYPGQPGWMYSTRARNYLVDSKGDVWLSFGELNSLLLFDSKEHRFRNLSNSPLLRITFCFNMVEDKQNNVWIAGDGLCRWNRAKDKIDTLIPFPRVSKSIFNYIQILDCDQDNNLWLASFDNEIIQYDCNNNKMYLRLRENSMIDGYSVTNSRIINDHIWLGMVNGISAFNIKNYTVKQFNYSDGLPSAVATSPRNGSFYDKSENRFYFGAGPYLISFIPDIKRSTKPPPIFALQVTVFKEIVPETIRLPYSQNNVELQFNVINFNDPEENRFAYRLLNEKDTSWFELDTKNIVLLSDLSPGNHRIQIKLYSVNNRWSSQTKLLNIIIIPPFWKTLWFGVTTILLAALGFYLLYHKRVRQIKQRANLDKLIAQTEMKALHSQMNPHFIFNCLNSIREMILNNENRQASHYLSKFAQLIRITLDNSSKPFLSLKSTIDYLHRYLEMEKIRTNGFTYTLEIDEVLEPEDIFLPPMLIQPFIENAIWHGQQPDRSMMLSIKFIKQENELVCIIEDDGIGIETSLKNKHNLDHHSVGIANIRQRIQLLNEKYHLKSSVLIEDKSASVKGNSTGTKVTLHLANKNAEL